MARLHYQCAISGMQASCTGVFSEMSYGLEFTYLEYKWTCFVRSHKCGLWVPDFIEWPIWGLKFTWNL